VKLKSLFSPVAQPDPTENQTTCEPLCCVEGVAKDQHAKQNTKNRDQINKAGGLACWNATNTIIVTTVGSKSDKSPEIGDCQQWLSAPVSREANIGEQKEGKEKEATYKGLESCQKQWRIVVGQVF